MKWTDLYSSVQTDKKIFLSFAQNMNFYKKTTLNGFFTLNVKNHFLLSLV